MIKFYAFHQKYSTSAAIQEGFLRWPLQTATQGADFKKKKQQNFRKLFQERKSVKIVGVTKAPAEESVGSSLQFLQVHLAHSDNLLVNIFPCSYSQEVTSDVLARGIFSERGLKSAIDHAVTARLGKVALKFLTLVVMLTRRERCQMRRERISCGNFGGSSA